MSIAYQVWKNVASCTLGSTSITGVQSIQVNRPATVVRASGDADAYETVAETAVTSFGGTITLLDPTQANALKGCSGTLTFTGKNTRGASDKTISIVNASISDTGFTASHGQASTATVSFVCYSSDGTTDPVTIS